MAHSTWNEPPFPPLVWNDGGWTWEGEIVLRSWAGFRSTRVDAPAGLAMLWWLLRTWALSLTGRGSPLSPKFRAPSDGTVELTVWSEVWTKPGPPAADEEPTPPMPAQSRALQYLLEREEEIRDTVLTAVLAEYQSTRDSYIYGLSHDEAEELMPTIDRIDQLRPLLGLHAVDVLAASKDGFAYIGFDFGCAWDEDHGIGVMTHRDRVIQVGGGDISSMDWVADEDSDADDH